MSIIQVQRAINSGDFVDVNDVCSIADGMVKIDVQDYAGSIVRVRVRALSMVNCRRSRWVVASTQLPDDWPR